MLEDIRKSKACIVTPSRIYRDKDGNMDHERIRWATLSIISLRQSINFLPHVVVDDSHDPSYAQNIYQYCHLAKGTWESMLQAMIQACNIAQDHGAEIVFIHLDDMVYVKQAGILARHAMEAMLSDDGLQVIHLSNFPLLDNGCKPIGNKKYLTIEPDAISFDSVRLVPRRNDQFTLWYSEMTLPMVQGQYWPLALWFAFYRVDFLLKLLLLVRNSDKEIKNLARSEILLRRPDTWSYVIQNWPGRIGYVNMQFGGLEMHRNKNFEELIALPNEEVI